MKKNNKIKLYTYHGNYLRIKHKTGNSKLKFLTKTADIIFDVFYAVGLAVINIFKIFRSLVLSLILQIFGFIFNSLTSIYKSAKLDFLNTRKVWPKRFKLMLQPQYSKTLLLFFLIAFLGWVSISSLHLVAKGLEIKNKILHTAFIGNYYLSQAKDALGQQNFNLAENKFTVAYIAINNGQKKVAESGQILNQLLSLIPQKNDADKLISAAAYIAEAGQALSSLEQSLASFKISIAGINAGSQDTGTIFGNSDNLISLSLDKLTKAKNIISEVNINSIPNQNKQSFLDLKDKLYVAQFTLNNFKSVFDLGKNILLGDKNVLFVLENNNELRATGGFIGTYGNLKIHNGSISKINVSSIYDLDGQLTKNIQPPLPVLNLNDRWFMRDSNWFASWPESAKKISNFYEMEGGETPDLVIALTPNIIVDWLKITGPITLPKYNITLTSENFVEQTQVITTLSNELPVNQPKQILADLFPILLEKISSVDKGEWPQIAQSLQDNLNSKQIVIYSKDPNLESQLADFHWAGSIEDTDRDFLSIVASNLGGTKTDLNIEQQINLITNIAADGSVTNELQITRTNKMPDLPQTGNSSFIRIYTPLGSKLISNIGFNYKNLDYAHDKKYTTDDDVAKWEKSLLKDVVTGTVIGEESGKTFFGNWVELKGGETRSVKVVYKMPFKLDDIDRYSLLFQKQIGAGAQDFNWTLNFDGRQIAWKNFDPETLNTYNLNSDILITKDNFFGLVLSKN